jgi:methionyl-tRNA formyltransferase
LHGLVRLLIFTDTNGVVTASLIEATLRLARERGDLEVAGIVTTHPERFRATALQRCKRIARGAIVAAANPQLPFRSRLPHYLDLFGLQRRTGIRVLVPPDGSLHEPAFLRLLADDARPEVALSVYCLRIFPRPLLDLFDQAVNFHNGLLPRYRGLKATSFAIYAGEPNAGFTFHRMTEGIDEGPILVQEPVPIHDREGLAEVTERTAEQAVAALPGVLDRVVALDPGLPQIGPGSYFSNRDVRAMVQIDAPEQLGADELQRRLRAFGTLSITIHGARYPVTRLRRVAPGRPLAFRTADGRVLAPDRLRGLPRFLYRRSGLP